MPAKLDIETVAVKWWINEEDKALLDSLYPREVNTKMRELIHAFCEHKRAQLKNAG